MVETSNLTRVLAQKGQNKSQSIQPSTLFTHCLSSKQHMSANIPFELTQEKLEVTWVITKRVKSQELNLLLKYTKHNAVKKFFCVSAAAYVYRAGEVGLAQ